MNFILALLAWLIIAAVLVAGIVLAAKGSLWLLLLGALGFVLLFSKYGCLTH
jgi:hypothetical protein